MKIPFQKVENFTFATKTPITDVANSGAEDPAAINVAPATSGDKLMAVKD